MRLLHAAVQAQAIPRPPRQTPHGRQEVPVPALRGRLLQKVRFLSSRLLTPPHALSSPSISPSLHLIVFSIAFHCITVMTGCSDDSFYIWQRSDHLKIHVKTHDTRKPFQCHVCQRGYSTAAALTSHMLNHRRRDSAMDRSSRCGSLCSDSTSSPISSSSPSSSSSASSSSSSPPPLLPAEVTDVVQKSETYQVNSHQL